MQPDTLTLRRATPNDADLLLAWRNDPVTREASHNTAEVPRSEHLAWLASVIDDPHRELYVAEENGVPVGTVRSELVDGVHELSWTVAPGARGRGVAKRMVALLADRIDAPIRAEIRSGNPASARIAEHAGMTLAGESGGVLHYRRAARA